MAEQSVVPERRISTEFVALMSFAVTSVVALLSLVVWLDGKFEQLDAKFEDRFEKLDAKFERRFEKLHRKIEDLGAELRSDISVLRAGQASLDKRLAVVESHVLGIPQSARPENLAAPAS